MPSAAAIRPFFVWVHRWAGLLMAVFLLAVFLLAVFLIVVGLTGSLLAFNAELERLISPQLYALHMASVFGLPHRIVVCVLGPSIVMLSVTGVSGGRHGAPGNSRRRPRGWPRGRQGHARSFNAPGDRGWRDMMRSDAISGGRALIGLAARGQAGAFAARQTSNLRALRPLDCAQ